MWSISPLRAALFVKVPAWPITVVVGSVALLLLLIDTNKDSNNNVAEEAVAVPVAGDKMDDDAIAQQAHNEGTKLVLVVRGDMALSKGTVAQLCAQVTLECYKKAQRMAPRVLSEWEYTGQAKVTLKCPNADELAKLQEQADATGLVACTSNSVNGEPAILGIGPGPIGLVNTVSGSLKLY
ncbi:hypothetical protein EV175_003867 [Coemansia sp. RSA 1933]|nr:hypothetical protein EV175_003867 [Coemansia sp. RSA 1933]